MFLSSSSCASLEVVKDLEVNGDVGVVVDEEDFTTKKLSFMSRKSTTSDFTWRSCKNQSMPGKLRESSTLCCASQLTRNRQLTAVFSENEDKYTIGNNPKAKLAKLRRQGN